MFTLHRRRGIDEVFSVVVVVRDEWIAFQRSLHNSSFSTDTYVCTVRTVPVSKKLRVHEVSTLSGFSARPPVSCCLAERNGMHRWCTRAGRFGHSDELVSVYNLRALKPYCRKIPRKPVFERCKLFWRRTPSTL